MICKVCGSEVPDGAEYCEVCGAYVKEQNPEETPNPVQQNVEPQGGPQNAAQQNVEPQGGPQNAAQQNPHGQQNIAQQNLYNQQNPYMQQNTARQNPYNQQNPYGQQNAARQNPYNQQNPYGQQNAARQNPYNQQNPYGQQNTARQNPYDQQNPYGQQNAARQNPYNQQNPYGQQNAARQNPYDQQNPYGQQNAARQNPYDQQNPYGQSGGYGQMQPNPQRPPVYAQGGNQAVNRHGMKWFKFIIWVQLFLSAIGNIVNTVLYFTGAHWTQGSQNISDIMYHAFPSLKSTDIVFGVVSILLAAFAIFVRFRLSGYKKNGPILLYIYIIITVICSFLYAAIVAGVVRMRLTSVLTPATWGSMIGMVILLIINILYFRKRKDVFVQ